MAVCLATSAIFSVKQWRDLRIHVRGRWRSLKMVPFDRPYATFYSSVIVYRPIAQSCKIFDAPAGDDPVEILWKCLMLVKLVIGLSYGEKNLWRYVTPFSSDTAENFVLTAVLARRLLVIRRLTFYKQDDTLWVMRLLMATASLFTRVGRQLNTTGTVIWSL